MLRMMLLLLLLSIIFDDRSNRAFVASVHKLPKHSLPCSCIIRVESVKPINWLPFCLLQKRSNRVALRPTNKRSPKNMRTSKKSCNYGSGQLQSRWSLCASGLRACLYVRHFWLSHAELSIYCSFRRPCLQVCLLLQQKNRNIA